MNIILILLALLWPISEAVYEGLYDSKERKFSAIIEIINKLLGVASTAFVTYGLTKGLIDIPLWKLLLGFLFIRFLVFDYTYNITRKLPLGFYGTTKLYDRVMSKLTSWGHFVKVICGVVGTAFLLGLK